MRTRSLKVLMAGVVVGLVCLVASPTTHTALARSTAHPDLTWLAAGDSYSSGQGLPDRSGSCAQADPRGGRGPAAWASWRLEPWRTVTNCRWRRQYTSWHVRAL
jgi:hypothetical protein